MLCIAGSGQREHPDLHGKAEYYLRNTGPQPSGDSQNGWISHHSGVGGEQGKALIDDVLGAADLPYLLIPARHRVTPVLHHHWFGGRLRAELGELIRCYIANANHS